MFPLNISRLPPKEKFLCAMCKLLYREDEAYPMFLIGKFGEFMKDVRA